MLLLLPTVMAVGRENNLSPSRYLLCLAYGSLLVILVAILLLAVPEISSPPPTQTKPGQPLISAPDHVQGAWSFMQIARFGCPVVPGALTLE